MERIVDGREDETDVGAPEEALHQPQQEAPDADPLERRQHDLEELVHVDALGRDEAVDHAEQEARGGEEPECDGQETGVQHGFLRFGNNASVAVVPAARRFVVGPTVYAVAAVPAVSEQVQGDEGDEQQDEEPFLSQPFHGKPRSALEIRAVDAERVP
jgi:hypothetical protein